jgi:hypothetical protein
MALSDIYMLTLTQRYGSGGEKSLNNFYYERSSSTGTSNELRDLFTAENSVLWDINHLQNTHMVNDSIRIINLGDEMDFLDYNLTGGGSETASDSAPFFVGIGYTLKIDTRAVRPGSKRFPGQESGWFNAGVWAASSLMTQVESLRENLAAVLNGDTANYAPVVVKRIRIEPDETHSRVRYLLPLTDEDLVVGHVVTALFGAKAAHQVSRGNGR